jgi:ABC-type multidrug transport system permease subunit
MQAVYIWHIDGSPIFGALAHYLCRMRFIRPAGILAAIVLCICCYFPWFVLASKQITVSGVDAESIRWGKPAYGHFFFCGLFLLFHLKHSVALRVMAIIIAVLNIAWAVRDIYIGLGNNGETIVMQPALYVLISCSFFMLVAVLLAPEKRVTNQT